MVTFSIYLNRRVFVMCVCDFIYSVGFFFFFFFVCLFFPVLFLISLSFNASGGLCFLAVVFP